MWKVFISCAYLPQKGHMCQNCMLIITPILNCNDQLGPDLFWSHFLNFRCSPCITNSAPGIRPVQALQSALLPVPASAAPHLHLRTNYLAWTAHSTFGMFLFWWLSFRSIMHCIYINMTFNPCPVCPFPNIALNWTLPLSLSSSPITSLSSGSPSGHSRAKWPVLSHLQVSFPSEIHFYWSKVS